MNYTFNKGKSKGFGQTNQFYIFWIVLFEKIVWSLYFLLQKIDSKFKKVESFSNFLMVWWYGHDRNPRQGAPDTDI